MSLHLFKANNLGDVDDIDKARENLGISRDIVDPNNVDIKGGSIAVEHFRLNQSEPFEKGYILTADSNGAARWSVLELSNLHEVTNISSFINNVPYASEEWTTSNFMRNEDNLSGITDRVAALSNLGLNYTFGDSEDPSEGFLQVFNIEMSNLKVNDRIETKEITVNDKLVFNNDFISSNNVLYVDPFTKEFRTFELGNDFEDLTTDIIDDSTRRPPSMALLNTVYHNLTQNLATVESTLENIVIDNFYLRITKNLSDILDAEAARYNLGFGGITISNNSIQTGSLHLDDEFRLVTSSFQDGQFLMCDATGSGTWQSLPIAGVTQDGLVRLTTDYNYDTANDNTIVTSLKTIKTYNDTFSASTQNKIDLCLKTANLLSEFRDISMNDRSVLLSNLHITESDIFEFPKHLGFFQDDVGYLRADNFLSELTGYGYGIEQTRSNLQLEKVAWTGSYFDLIDTPYLDEFSNVFLQIDKNLSELADSEANRTAARENLGLSDMCTMSRSNIDIYGGVITDLTSIKTSEFILNDTPVPETFFNTCFLKATDDTGKATWALLPDATPTQKGVITLKNEFNQHDDASAYTSTFMHGQISSIKEDINSILIDTNAIDANINSNADAIESLSTAVSVAIYHPATGLDHKVTTLTTDLESLGSLSDERYNEFIVNNVTWFNNLSNLSITTDLHIDRVESELETKIDFVYSNILNTDVGQLSLRLDFEVETLNSNLEDEVEILNTSIGTATYTLNESISTATDTLNESISTTANSLSVSISTATETLNTSISTATNSLSVSISTATDTLNTSISTATDTLNTSISTATDTLNTSISTATNSLSVSISTTTDTLNTSISTATNSLSVSISTATDTLNTRITSETSNLDLKIEDIKEDLNKSDDSLSNLRDDFIRHVIEYEELYLLVDSGTGSNHLTYKVNKLERDVYGTTADDPHGIRGDLDNLIDDFNAFSNVAQDARDRVLVLETNYGHTSNDIIRIDQEIEDINDDVMSNQNRITALETHQGNTNGHISDLRNLISDNDSNITINLELINTVITDLQVHKTDYEHLEEDVNSNIHKITALQDSLWGISDQNTFGVKGHLSNLQDDFDTHVLDITGQISTLSTLIEKTDSNLEQTDKDLSSLSNVFENHLIHYGYLEKDVDSNIDRINALEHSLWGTDSESPTGIRGDLNTYMSDFNQHLLDYGHLKNYSESNIHDIDTRLQLVEGGSDAEQQLLNTTVYTTLPNRISTLEGVVESVEIVANGSVGVVNTLSDSVYSFSNTLDTFSEDIESLSNLLSNTTARLNVISDPDNDTGIISTLSNTLDTFSEDFESLSNLLSNTTARLNVIRDPDNDAGIISTNTEAIRALTENRFDPFELEFNNFSQAIINSNNVFTSDISSLSNIILDPTNGLSTLVSDLQGDLATLNGEHGVTNSLVVSLSNDIHDSHAGLSVRLESNVDHTIRIQETDIPSIDSEISNIKADLGISDGGSGGSGTYLQKSTWDNWIGVYGNDTDHYQNFYQQVNGPDGSGGLAKQINDNEASVAVNHNSILQVSTDLTETINNNFNSITDIYTLPTSGDTPAMRLSISSGRMYIQKDNGFGNWQNLHIFR